MYFITYPHRKYIYNFILKLTIVFLHPLSMIDGATVLYAHNEAPAVE